eukprot:9526966-Alexandrium_andersonii.AAC.1
MLDSSSATSAAVSGTTGRRSAPIGWPAMGAVSTTRGGCGRPPFHPAVHSAFLVLGPGAVAVLRGRVDEGVALI